jgi:hypothetical protein
MISAAAATLASVDVWAMDFVHDQLATGKTIRVLTVVDTFSRLSPVIDPRFSYRAEDVVATPPYSATMAPLHWPVLSPPSTRTVATRVSGAL